MWGVVGQPSRMRTMSLRAVRMMRAGACHRVQRSRLGSALARGPVRQSSWNHLTRWAAQVEVSLQLLDERGDQLLAAGAVGLGQIRQRVVLPERLPHLLSGKTEEVGHLRQYVERPDQPPVGTGPGSECLGNRLRLSLGDGPVLDQRGELVEDPVVRGRSAAASSPWSVVWVASANPDMASATTTRKVTPTLSVCLITTPCCRSHPHCRADVFENGEEKVSSEWSQFLTSDREPGADPGPGAGTGVDLEAPP